MVHLDYIGLYLMDDFTIRIVSQTEARNKKVDSWDEAMKYIESTVKPRWAAQQVAYWILKDQ